MSGIKNRVGVALIGVDGLELYCGRNSIARILVGPGFRRSSGQSWFGRGIGKTLDDANRKHSFVRHKCFDLCLSLSAKQENSRS